MMTMPGEQETRTKLATLRGWLEQYGARAIRLRGVDWFAWATAGASNAVLLASECGVAEVLVTPDAAYLLTDEIEVERLKREEVLAHWTWQVVPWAQRELREHFVLNAANGGLILSDRPGLNEHSLGPEVREARLQLCGHEQVRYRQVGRLAAAAMSEALRAARPDWTEYELAGAGAHALWARGLQPALVLAAGEQRLMQYRHPLPSIQPLGRRAMLVFCARRFGLYANLTRFVRFERGHPDAGADGARALDEQIMALEAVALDACEPGAPLAAVYNALDSAYAYAGWPDAIRAHHQGGITGYLAREILATDRTGIALKDGMALAFNPSLPGIKIEDTFLLDEGELKNLTFDPAWPCAMAGGRRRPLALVVR